MNSFEKIRKDGRLLYEYVRGSHLYGLNNEDSDLDTGGVFICNPNEVLGFIGYQEQISDERHDNTWYEIGNFIKLSCKSNPTVLESIFAPSDKVLYKHPMMDILIDNRDKFITKQCFNPFFGYAKSQIEKARGLNKKIVNPVTERLIPLDFCYIFKDGGDYKLKEYMSERDLKQNYCGLVHISHLQDIYAVYYDWGNHILQEGLDVTSFADLVWHQDFDANTKLKMIEDYDTYRNNPYGCCGILNEDEDGTCLRLSSIPKGISPLVYMGYNASEFSKHCVQYKQYQEWVKFRNPKRYESNLNKNYDSKNMMHCFRLIHMAKEIARGEGINLVRTYDHDFLMDVRNHKYEYEEIISMLEQEKDEMNILMAQSTIPERIDENFVNDILLDIRKRQMKGYVND